MTITDIRELQDSPVETETIFGLEATRTFIVPWGQRHSFVRAKIEGTGEIYPYKPQSGAVAMRATIKPFGGVDELLLGGNYLTTYEAALITIEYRTRTSLDPQTTPGGGGTVGGSTLYSQSLEPNAEMIRLDPKDFAWKGPPMRLLEEGQEPSKLIVTFDYVLTLYRRLGVSYLAKELIGHVNDSPILALLIGMNFEPESLLFNPPSVQVHSGPDGFKELTVTYRFTYRKPNWNKFWNKTKPIPGTSPAVMGDWDEIVHAKEPNPVYKNYPLADFTVLTT